MLTTALTNALSISYPVIQAPMAGGATTPELVAAVSNAGGLGSLGAGYMSPNQMASAITRIRALTHRPFAVNLFVPQPYDADADEIAAMNATLDTFRQHLDIPCGPTVAKFSESFAAQLEVVLAERVPVFSFTFGMVEASTMAKLKQAGIYTIGTATTVDEAIQLEQAGVDAVVAQGSEAGGHRGTFAHPPTTALIGTIALVPQIVDHVQVPVVASGGIMDGRGLAACRMLGAAAVQMGTAFLTCPESGVHPKYKEALLQATEASTAVTSVYSGRAARGIMTEFMEKMAAYEQNTLPYPVQNALTRDIRQAAARQANTAYMSLWAGQGLRLVQARDAAQVVADTVRGGETLLYGFSTQER